MNKTQLLTSALFASGLAVASAYDVTHTVDISGPNPITSADGVMLGAGDFTMRLGYFNYNSDFAQNNAAVVANQNNLASLNSNFVPFFVFDPAQQAEGDTGAANDVNGAFTGPGLFYAYLFTDNANYTSSFSSFPGKNLYAWIQRTGNPSEQAIFGSSGTFNSGADPFNAETSLQILEGNPTLQLLVGDDRTATASNDYVLVPEPTTALLLFAGLGAVGFVRRRA